MLNEIAIALDLISQIITVQANIQAPQAVERPLNEEQLVRLTFWDDPHMVETLKCESRFRQYDATGSVLKSPTNDSGIAQINDIHRPEAEKLGFNIDTLEGNLGFARYLYDREGSRPWVCSRIVAARS